LQNRKRRNQIVRHPEKKKSISIGGLAREIPSFGQNNSMNVGGARKSGLEWGARSRGERMLETSSSGTRGEVGGKLLR